jgi:hypothetical protein
LSITAITLGLEKWERPVAKAVKRVIDKSEYQQEREKTDRKPRVAKGENAYDHLKAINDKTRLENLVLYRAAMFGREMTSEQVSQAVGRSLDAAKAQIQGYKRAGLVEVAGGKGRHLDPFRYRWAGE